MCFEFRDTSLVDTFMSDNQLNMKDGACFQCETFWMSSYLPIFENFEKTLYWIMGEWCVSNFETLLYHTQSWVKHDWIWVMDWCVECGCMLVSSSNFSAWENVEENKNEAFLILFLRHSELNQCVGRSHSKQRYRDGIEIKILRGMFGMRVWERMIFFLNFQKFQRTILTILKTWWNDTIPTCSTSRSHIHHREKGLKNRSVDEKKQCMVWKRRWRKFSRCQISSARSEKKIIYTGWWWWCPAHSLRLERGWKKFSYTRLSEWQLVSNAFISFAPRQEIEKKPYEPSSSIIVECWDSLVWNLSYFPTPRNRFLVRKSTTSIVAERISQDSSIQSTSLPKLVCAICRRYHLDIMCMVWWLVEWIEWYLDYIFRALSPSFPQL